jgi:DNA end-binding protein Ku
MALSTIPRARGSGVSNTEIGDLMRSVHTGGLGFGLVNVPFKMYTATESHDVKFHQHHAACGGPITMQRVCSACGDEQHAAVVEYNDIVKGITRDETLVLLSKEDIDGLDTEAGAGMEVLKFVHASEVDPVLYEGTYYLAPDDNKGKNKSAVEGYALLRHVLGESERVGIVRYTYRQKTHIGVLRVLGEVLAVHPLRWPDEVRPTDELTTAHRKVELSPKMVKVAEALVESMMGSFDPAEYTDAYTARLTELVDAKAAGGEFVPAESDDDDGADDVSDLLAKLEASIATKG